MRSASEHRSDTIATSSTTKAGPPQLAGFASIARTAVEKPATTGNDIIHDFTTGVDMIDHCNLTPTNLQSAVRQHVYSGLYAWGLIAVSLLARNQPAMTATRALKCLHVTHTESCTAKCSFRVADKGQKKQSVGLQASWGHCFTRQGRGWTGVWRLAVAVVALWVALLRT